MSDGADASASADGELQCDCGYRCRGETLEARVRDAQRHAQEAHGIDVSEQQVLRRGGTAWV